MILQTRIASAICPRCNARLTQKYDLFELIKSADGSISISPTDLKILQDISVYSDLRYPDKAGEIGDDDLEAIEKLDDFLWQILPQNLISIYENINPAHKGYRRILLTKRKS